MVKLCVKGVVLKWARETANILIEEVARRLKKPPDVIELWEKEEDFPMLN